MLCLAAPCRAMPCCGVPCNALPWLAMPWLAVQCRASHVHVKLERSIFITHDHETRRHTTSPQMKRRRLISMCKYSCSFRHHVDHCSQHGIALSSCLLSSLKIDIRYRVLVWRSGLWHVLLDITMLNAFQALHHDACT